MAATRTIGQTDLEDLELPGSPGGPLRLSSIALDVTGACNMACRYCAEAATQPSRRAMKLPELEAAWNLLFPGDRPQPGTSIRLGSGEPLLSFPLLRRLDSLIVRKGGNAAEGRPAVFLTTNGTLATREVRDWLVDSGWHVKISLDGPREIHDRWRIDRTGRGTWSLVSEAVKDLSERMPTRFSVTAVLCRGTEPAEVFRAIEALGTRRIELVPAAHDDPGILPTGEDVERYRHFIDGYTRRFVAGVHGRDIPMLVRFETAVRRVMGYDLQSVPCGAGRNFVGLGPDGSLYPCFRFIGLTDYRLGSLRSGLDDKAVADFADGVGRPLQSRESCRNCSVAPLCGGPCFAVAETFGEMKGEPPPVHCDYVRVDAEQAVILVRRLREEDPETLLAFLPRLRHAVEHSSLLN